MLNITFTAGIEVTTAMPRVRIKEEIYLPREGITRIIKDKKTRRMVSIFSNDISYD